MNCARGALLDYDAVCDALDSGHLFGAAFDVFAEEPIPAGSRLLTTPDLVMTPHLAGGSKEDGAAGGDDRGLGRRPVPAERNPRALRQPRRPHRVLKRQTDTALGQRRSRKRHATTTTDDIEVLTKIVTILVTGWVKQRWAAGPVTPPST